MRFNFFRNRLSIESLSFGMGPSFPSPQQVQAPPTEAPGNATVLKPGITGDAAKLPIDGGKVSLTENINRESDLKPDTFGKTAFGLDDKSRDLLTKESAMAWGALGATPGA